jgi:G:T-mismatch repair DNA endonuclease (very short patch repair protein)
MPKYLFGKPTSIERKLYKLLNKLHIEYRCNHSIKGGFNVDAFIPGLNLIIEAFGDYYHAYPGIYKKEQLNEMQIKNVDRDKRKMPFFNELYSYLIFWEHDINKRDFGKRFNKLFKEAQEKIIAGQKFQYLGE